VTASKFHQKGDPLRSHCVAFDLVPAARREGFPYSFGERSSGHLMRAMLDQLEHKEDQMFRKVSLANLPRIAV
jgi:hypothetical protein